MAGHLVCLPGGGSDLVWPGREWGSVPGAVADCAGGGIAACAASVLGAGGLCGGDAGRVGGGRRTEDEAGGAGVAAGSWHVPPPFGPRVLVVGRDACAQYGDVRCDDASGGRLDRSQVSGSVDSC